MSANIHNSFTSSGTRVTLETDSGTYSVQSKPRGPMETIWDIRDDVLIPVLLAAGYHLCTVDELFCLERS